VVGGDGVDSVSGDTGDDSVMGGAGPDVVSGGDGNDSLEGGGSAVGCANSGGEDLVNGDAGDDALCGGDGPVAGVSDNDSLNGGSGVDHVFYPRTRPVTISLDGAVGDGEAGESDNVSSDIEDATGGRGNDRLIGNDGANLLDGAGGADSLSGMGGNDTLTDSGGDVAGDTLDGGAGDDSLSAGYGPDTYTGGDGEDALIDYIGRTVSVSVTLDGQPDDGAAGEGDNVGPDVEDVTGGAAADTLVGNGSDNELAGGGGDDTVSGGGGNDGVFGQAGRDTLDGGAGRDRIDGGGGPDTLKSRDGETDRVECGGGTDSGQGEARDDISGDCENMDIAAPTGVTIASVVVTRSGFVVVRVACPAVERSCSGAIIVKTVRRVAKSFIKLGQVNYRLRGGDSRALRARISAKDRRALRRARRVKVRTVVTNANSDTGVSTTATRLAMVTTRGL
jgi:Ca2+-binding RTX toxin-like protein